MKKTGTKKALSLLLAALMLISVFAVTAFAGNYDTAATARNVTMGTNYSGSLSGSDYTDFYKINLTTSSTLHIDFTGDAYAYYEFLDNNGEKLDYAGITKNNLNIVSLKKDYILKRGVYYFKLETGPYDSCNYTVKFTSTSSGETFAEKDDTFDNPYSIKLNQTYKGQVALNEWDDYYKFTTNKDMTLNIYIKSDNYLWFYIYDNNEKEIYSGGYNLSGRFVANEKVKLSKGTYRFLVERAGSLNEGSNYTFELSDASLNFPDVSKEAWFYDAVKYCAGKGYMSGYSNGHFGPGDNLKRQDFVVILANIADVNLSSYASMTPRFKDVKKGTYYAAAVNWAVDNGIIAGYANGNFGVNDTITREQVATILYRYMGEPSVSNVNSTLSKFSDSGRISTFAKKPVAWAVQNNIISGMADGRVAPTEGASRAQIASIIMRMDQKGMF